MLVAFQAMVARGDLGAELPIEEVPLLQVSCLEVSLVDYVNYRAVFCLHVDSFHKP